MTDYDTSPLAPVVNVPYVELYVCSIQDAITLFNSMLGPPGCGPGSQKPRTAFTLVTERELSLLPGFATSLLA